MLPLAPYNSLYIEQKLSEIKNRKDKNAFLESIINDPIATVLHEADGHKTVLFPENKGPKTSTGSGVFAYIHNGDIIINGEGTLQVMDVMGRVIVCRDARPCVSTQGMTPGVYVLRLIQGDKVRTQKIVIE